jgi:high-affinity nickel permease
MNFAYGWALSKPVGKVFCNPTIAGLSAAGRAGDRDD